MYNCGVCRLPSVPGQGLLRHVVKRPNGSIEQEVPVCRSCFNLLGAGTPLADLRVFATVHKPDRPPAYPLPQPKETITVHEITYQPAAPAEEVNLEEPVFAGTPIPKSRRNHKASVSSKRSKR